MDWGWTSERGLWIRLAQEISGRRWRTVLLAELQALSVPEVAGVYLMCGGPAVPIPSFVDCKIFGPLYVGRATNLRRRFLDHCKRPGGNIDAIKHCWREGLEFWFSEMPDSEARLVEGLLIDCFGPRANRRREIRARLAAPVPA